MAVSRRVAQIGGRLVTDSTVGISPAALPVSSYIGCPKPCVDETDDYLSQFAVLLAKGDDFAVEVARVAWPDARCRVVESALVVEFMPPKMSSANSFIEVISYSPKSDKSFPFGNGDIESTVRVLLTQLSLAGRKGSLSMIGMVMLHRGVFEMARWYWHNGLPEDFKITLGGRRVV